MPSAEYQRSRREKRIPMARERLGGKCVRCGSTEDLEFDHIDPTSKVAEISVITNWSLSRFLEEVDKCQLLCRPCHRGKTKDDYYPGVCPTTKTGWWKCGCDACHARRRKHNREYMRKRRALVSDRYSTGEEACLISK